VGVILAVKAAMHANIGKIFHTFFFNLKASDSLFLKKWLVSFHIS
jgi:hypothetical protein